MKPQEIPYRLVPKYEPVLTTVLCEAIRVHRRQQVQQRVAQQPRRPRVAGVAAAQPLGKRQGQLSPCRLIAVHVGLRGME